MDPLASVIVPTLNGAAVIGRCLEQLLAQTHPRVEVIVVDDGSADATSAVVEPIARNAACTLVHQPTTRGIAAARNRGLQQARGEVIAFIDADGYADPNRLAEAIRTLAADTSLGAVAALVFFDEHKLILNGAGGTLNYRGYALDWGFDAPYEFAALPHEVLYPMGCGMVVRRTVMEAIAPLDEAVTNYYDDVELGIRVWASGARVVVCPTAWVDHGFGGSDPHGRHRLLLSERHRIRTALKYFPAAHLVPWLVREFRLLDYLRVRGRRAIPFAAWAWNLRHLSSAWAIRRRWAQAHRRFWPFLLPAWRLPARRAVPNRAFRPDPAAAGPRLRLDGTADAAQLNFGWYAAEHDSTNDFRPCAAVASAFVRLASPAEECVVIWRGSRAIEETVLLVRPLGDRTPIWQTALAPPPVAWEQRRLACQLPAGAYEVLLRSAPAWVDPDGRERGLDIAALQFAPRR